MRHQCYLTKGVRATVEDERTNQRYSFYFEGGIRSYVRNLNFGKEPVGDGIFYVEKQVDDSMVEVALQYTESYSETIKAFANNVLNPDGGTHLTGFRAALTRVINDYARKNSLLKEKEDNLSGEDCREGITAVILVKLPCNVTSRWANLALSCTGYGQRPRGRTIPNGAARPVFCRAKWWQRISA